MADSAYLTGKFLISGLNLFDPNFFRTVVLMLQHSDEGAFGLVVNRPAEYTLGTILPKLAGGEALDIPVYIGGPVQQDLLFALHSRLPSDGWESFTQKDDLLGEDALYHESPAATEPIPGLVFEPSTQDLVRYLVEEWEKTAPEDRPKIRLYAGYSGWGPNQLEQELREHAWFTHEASGDIVFHPYPEIAWKAALSEKGEYYKFVADTGYMPSVN